MTQEEKDQYRWKEKPKFVLRKGRATLTHGFNNDGKKYFSKYWMKLRKLANDPVKWEAAVEVAFCVL